MRLIVVAAAAAAVVVSGAPAAAGPAPSVAVVSRAVVVPTGGAAVFHDNWADGGPVTVTRLDGRGVRVSQRSTGSDRGPTAVCDRPLGAGAGRLLVARIGPCAGGGAPRRLVTTTAGRALFRARGVPAGCETSPNRCRLLPGGSVLVAVLDTGRVVRVNLRSGRSRTLALLRSTYPSLPEISYGLALSRSGGLLYANDYGRLVAVSTRTGVKRTLITPAPKAWNEIIPLCLTSSGRLIAEYSWYEGDPDTPPAGFVSVDLARRTVTRLVLWRSVAESLVPLGCTANGASLVMKRKPEYLPPDRDQQTDMVVLVGVRTGAIRPVVGTTQARSVVVDNGVTR